MGQKVNPYGYRLGISKDWMSRWYADKKHYGELVLEDLKIRKYLEKKFEMAGVKSIDIERSVNEINIIVKVAKPGVVIG
ncbi:MAG: 30S ribosomal protein S3, partial [uncultured bacterium]